MTVRRDGAPDGFTATAVIMVSIDPPIILVSATRDSSAGEMLGDAERFAVNLLHASQRAVAEGFAMPHEERSGRWSAVERDDDRWGVPLLRGALGGFSATVRQRVDAGDHVLVLGDVTAVHLGADGPPLLYVNRDYAGLSTERPS